MKVTVITTCYNAENCIGKTIESVLKQDFTDYEYIVMDGASKDKTFEIAKSYEKAFKEKGISYLCFSEPDHGIYEGMNHGLAHASGDYINFLNADDTYYDEKVLSSIFDKAIFDIDKCENGSGANTIGNISEPSCGDGCVASNNTYNKTGKTNEPDVIYGDALGLEFGQYYRHRKDISVIEKKMPFSHQSVFAKREILQKYPLNTKYKIGADYDFLLTAYTNGYKFLDSKVLVCVVTLDGLSSVDLYSTFIETVEIQRNHGINHYSETEYNKKLRNYKIKQIVMDHFPKFVIALIRKMQRISRGQNETVKN